jgi:RimJ/RimL family protein N-acetyltransferase
LDAAALETERLSLEPLRVEHAQEMMPLLADRRLHEFTGGDPPGLRQLRDSYRRRLEESRWCNWIVRHEESGRVVGGMQAEIAAGEDGLVAEVAWILGVEDQGRGYAREAAAAMIAWLREQGVRSFIGDIHERNEPSMRLARALGFVPTGEPVEHDGDVRWRHGEVV